MRYINLSTNVNKKLDSTVSREAEFGLYRAEDAA